MNCHEPQSHRSGKLREICEELVVPETGVVVVGHGTANLVGAAETKSIVSSSNDCLVLDSKFEHGFITAARVAHSKHIPLQFSPDDVWAMIVQGFS